MAYGRVLAVEYDGSTNVLRSIDGSLPIVLAMSGLPTTRRLDLTVDLLVLIRHQKLLNWSLAADFLMFRPPGNRSDDIEDEGLEAI